MMTMKQKQAPKRRRNDGPAAAPPAAGGGPSPLLEQARTYGAVAERALYEYDGSATAEQELLRRSNAPGQ